MQVAPSIEVGPSMSKVGGVVSLSIVKVKVCSLLEELFSLTF